MSKITYCRWKDEEIKKLFEFIQQQTNAGLTLTKAFARYATISGRKANSVRNYYYAELNYLQQNKQLAKNLNINLTAHKKVTPKYFSKQEAQQCVQSINNLVKQGNSVRKACLILSNGNISQMVRLQNKYRSLTKKPVLNKAVPSNIIAMPSRSKHLTQQEIDGLFLGLLKLIKASAKQEATQSLSQAAQSANHQLRKTLVVLAEKEKQLKKMQASFALLQQENNKAKETIKKLRSFNAETLTQTNEKMKKLQKYSSNLSQKKKPNLKANNK